MSFTRRQALGTGIALLGLGSGAARAQRWPERPIRLIAPYGAGGANDILSRLLAEALAPRLGQSLVVENKPGAGTRIANEMVARAAPDGYTVLHAAAPIAIGSALHARLPYDTATDFVPIVSTAIAPLYLVVNASAPYKTVAEFVAYGRSKADGLTFGSPGIGSAPHLTVELMMRASGTKGVVVQFKGDAPAYSELLAGRIDATLTAISTAIPHIQAGKLRALAVATEERTTRHPEVPTFRESGLDSVVGYGWYGLLAPAGTPADIVQRLNAETNAVLADPAVRQRAEAVGLQLRGGTSPAFAAFMVSETQKWSQVVKAAGITVE